jgi:hypothetical protein
VKLRDILNANNGAIVYLGVSFHGAVGPEIEVPVDATCIYVLPATIRDTELRDLFTPYTESAGLGLNNPSLKGIDIPKADMIWAH